MDNHKKRAKGMSIFIFITLASSLVVWLLSGCSSQREINSYQDENDQSRNRIILPVFMYYAERYFAEVPEPTEVDRGIRSILDESESGQQLIRRALDQYKAIPAEAKLDIYDPEIIRMTTDILQPLDLEQVRERWAEDDPQMVEIPKDPPADPNNLTATNRSKFEPITYEVELNWQDNSGNEDGFLIYRASKPAGSQAAQAMQQIGSVGPGITTYLDSPPGYTQGDNQYCYQVAAYRTNPVGLIGQPPQHLQSKPTNTACSYVAPGYPLGPLPPDLDKDGFPDADDECIGLPGIYPHGCPDKDYDGIADKDDMCETEAADLYFSYDNGPKPPASRLGCPTRYTLVWMGMKVLNNSGPYAYPGYEFIDPYGKTYGLYRNEADQECTSGEEPYLIFTWTNGLSAKGMVENGTSRWCCGDQVDVKAGKDFEPDTDSCAEEFPANLGDVLTHGFTAFPGSANQYAIIDEAAGLVMAITLMERDYEVTIIPQTQANELDAVFKMGGQVAGVIAACVGSGGFGCLASIGGALEGIIEGIFGLMQSGPPPINVADPDDFMGTDVWFITRQGALEKTSSNGAYAFTIPEMPTPFRYSCLGAEPCSVSSGVPTTLRIRPSFCLVREGVPKSDYKKVCTPFSYVVPWPMK
jgi:hypothetical protein